MENNFKQSENNQNNQEDNGEIQEDIAITEQQHLDGDNNHMTIDKKIIKRIWIIILSGIAYLFIRLFSNNSDETYQFVDFIVIITTIFGIFGVVIYLHNHQKTKELSKNRLFEPGYLDLTNKKKIYEIVDIVTIIPICAVIVTFVFAFIFIFPVSGPSMNPNVEDGEKMFAIVGNKVERFDVVVIQIDPKYYDHNVRERFLKRIIGLPGDTLAHNGTQLFINNQVVSEPFLLDSMGNLKTDLFGIPYSTPSFHFVPSNSNKVCRIIVDDVETICPVEGNVMVIPEGYYFVLGDNRPNSKDSPELGLIREQDIIGIVKYHIYSIFEWKKVE